MEATKSKDLLLKIFLMSRFVIKATKKFDKEKTMKFTIMALIDEKPRTIRELATLLTVNHSFMSTVVSKMQKEGLIKKKVHKDQRFRQIALTKKGQEARSHVSGQGLKIARVLFKDMSKEDLAQLEECLSKLNLDFKALLASVYYDYHTLK